MKFLMSLYAVLVANLASVPTLRLLVLLMGANMGFILFLIVEPFPTELAIKFSNHFFLFSNLSDLVVLIESDIFPLMSLLHVNLQVPSCIENLMTVSTGRREFFMPIHLVSTEPFPVRSDVGTYRT